MITTFRFLFRVSKNQAMESHLHVHLSIIMHVYHKTYLCGFLVGPFIIAQSWKPSRCLSLAERIINCQISHNRISQGDDNNNLPLQATIWLNVINTMLSKRHQTQKSIISFR